VLTCAVQTNPENERRVGGENHVVKVTHAWVQPSQFAFEVRNE
jgi:hypothetical protein